MSEDEEIEAFYAEEEREHAATLAAEEELEQCKEERRWMDHCRNVTQSMTTFLMMHNGGQDRQFGFFVVLNKFCPEDYHWTEEVVAIFHPSVTREQVDAYIATLPKTYADTWLNEQESQYKVYQAPYITTKEDE